jgi:hypothetical protein
MAFLKLWRRVCIRHCAEVVCGRQEVLIRQNNSGLLGAIKHLAHAINSRPQFESSHTAPLFRRVTIKRSTPVFIEHYVAKGFQRLQQIDGQCRVYGILHVWSIA